MMNGARLATDLNEALVSMGPVAVAVSGGVDSLTLAEAAHRVFGEQFQAFHAVSPAVPPSATKRVKQLANQRNWTLKIINAGEFNDTNYLTNPVNRCFYCKFNLYGSITGSTELQVVSGTNKDDLSDFRPGLKAAGDHRIRHPFVEAGINKDGIRALARHFGLETIAELPAAPCLSSRLQTGIAVTAERLLFIDQVEDVARKVLSPGTVRCRILSERVEVQLDAASLEKLEKSSDMKAHIVEFMSARQSLPVAFALYRQGSSVVHGNG
jgi:uncharacterized protein